jgi:signal transduction histidine kinase
LRPFSLPAADPAALGAAGVARRLQRLARRSAPESIAARVIVTITIAAVVTASAFVALVLAMSGLGRSIESQSHVRAVTRQTIELQRIVNELDSSLRAYVATGNQRLLAHWRARRTDAGGAIESLTRLVADDPSQSAQVAGLAVAIRLYLSDYSVPLVAIAGTEPAAARSSVASSEGLLRMNAIRTTFARVLASQEAVAAGQAAAARNRAADATRFGLAALAVCALLLAAVVTYLIRAVARPVRHAASASARISTGDLTTRLPVTGPTEVHELADSFNTMAGSLESGRRALERQNEELRQSERLKSELVSIVSHELRTPLAAMLGYTNLLLKRSPSEEDARRYLEIVAAQGERLASLVDDFLDVQRVEEGRLQLAADPVDLAALVRDEVQLHLGSSQAIEIDVPARLPVRGDRTRIAQVLNNLVANAVKYSPADGRITVSGARDASLVRITVRDEGFGIAEEHQPHVFTKFFRGGARESGIAGSGLGLAVAREIVEAHGGRIGFESTVGVGSSFWFELPAD